MQTKGLGFPTRKPYGYPNSSYKRIRVTKDVFHTDGHLRVQKGATGITVANDRGEITVLFDEEQDLHIELSGCGNLIQQVPYDAIAVQQ